MGVLLPTMSQLPCSVKNLSEKPRTSRSASAAPCSPATVDQRDSTSVCLPTSEKRSAQVYCVMSWVTVKVPCAPQPLACTTRSGMRSRFWWASFSISW